MELPKIPAVISYVPLFYPQWPAEAIQTEWKRKQVFEALKEAAGDELAAAKGCAWVSTDGGLNPVFVLDRGMEIYKHINWWSQDHPEKFFELHILQRDSGYSCGLFPNLKNSTNRLEFNLKERETSLPIDDAATVFFVPLTFVCRDKPNILDNRPAPKGKIDFGIIDPALVDSNHQFDVGEVCWLRNIPVRDKAWIELLERLLDPK